MSLAVALRRVAGLPEVQVVGRGADPPDFLLGLGEDAPEYVQACRWAPPAGDGSLGLFLSVPDDALEAAARQWSDRLAASAAGAGDSSGPAGDASPSTSHATGLAGDAVPPLAFHTSGAHSEDVLSPLRNAAGCRTGIFHPLRAVPRADPSALSGATFGVGGDPEAVEAATELARSLGGDTLTVVPGRQPLYHASAVFASNLLVACLELARQGMAEAVEEDVAPGTLVALARSALEAVAGGMSPGLTGPVARGDTGTVERHLAALDPGARRLYASLTEILARDVAGVEGTELDDLIRLLRDRGGAASSEGPEESHG